MPPEKEIIVPAGGHRVRILAPREARDDPDGRIFFWWGLTASAVTLAGVLAEKARTGPIRVLELGCGLGLPGIAAALSGARVTFTDIKEEALQYARRNAAANGLDEDRVRFSVLDWEDPAMEERFDLVAGAEIVYDYFLHDDLLAVARKLLAPSGTLLLADRKRTVVDRFMGRLHDRGFRISRSEHSIGLPGEAEQSVSIYEATGTA